jgi:hypothetical protein
MDINAKKVEIIQHILILQKPSVLSKIHKFILDTEEDDSDGFHHKNREPLKDGSKSGFKRANVIGSKIKGMLNLYDK